MEKSKLLFNFNILFKKVSLITLALVMCTTFINAKVSFATEQTATETSSENSSEISNEASTGNVAEDAVNKINSGEGVYGVIQEIMGILFTAGFAISVFKVAQIGVMLLMSPAGSKSNAKGMLIPWLIGVFVCATFGIIGPWIINIIAGDSSGGVFDI